ncbi:uncharacterized protein FOBCDRAFT_276742 [Fusarium oxysporum Fo47]|uniref:uncharacterized protein n=1 Tax=Fusarium oxysporum Fo47 TaxID=660027 RepID=UPI00159A18ED|nr:uncharacterized protein FOBCDRAFT_276742 [Fusarium oxysporum Fo47]QKD57128.1 hypothetical protein FOBCDRAFT_276742 [Fusarium oxysporum Fo47]
MAVFSNSPVPLWILFAPSAGLGILVILLYICIYRLLFHPYHKYPGPFLAKLTSWYSVYHTYYGDLHLDIWECHQKYGNCVRYAPNGVLINTPEGLKGTIHNPSFATTTLSPGKIKKAPPKLINFTYTEFDQIGSNA